MASDCASAEQDAAHERAERTAEAADDRRDEAVDGERHADIEGGVLRRRDQHAGERAERRAEARTTAAACATTGMPCSAAASRLCAQARIALPVLVAVKNRSSSAIISGAAAEDPEQLVADRDPPILSGGRSVNSAGARLVAERDQGQALDHDLRRERRQDDGEHGRAAVPHRPHHEALDARRRAPATSAIAISGGEQQRQAERVSAHVARSCRRASRTRPARS